MSTYAEAVTVNLTRLIGRHGHTFDSVAEQTGIPFLRGRLEERNPTVEDVEAVVEALGEDHDMALVALLGDSVFAAYRMGRDVERERQVEEHLDKGGHAAKVDGERAGEGHDVDGGSDGLGIESAIELGTRAGSAGMAVAVGTDGET